MNNFNTLYHDIHTIKNSIQILAKTSFDTDARIKKLETDVATAVSTPATTPLQVIVDNEQKEQKEQVPTLSVAEIQDLVNEAIKKLKIEALVKNTVDKVVEKAVDDKINAVISPKIDIDNDDVNEEIIIPDIIPNSKAAVEISVETDATGADAAGAYAAGAYAEDDIILGIKEEKKPTTTNRRKSNKIAK